MSIFDQAVDLGRGIARTEEFKNMKEAEQAVSADSAARKAANEYQELQHTYYRMQVQGRELTGEHMNILREAEERAMSNQMVKRYYQSRLQFHEMLERVNSKIQEGITGIPAEHACGGG